MVLKWEENFSPLLISAGMKDFFTYAESFKCERKLWLITTNTEIRPMIDQETAERGKSKQTAMPFTKTTL